MAPPHDPAPSGDNGLEALAHSPLSGGNASPVIAEALRLEAVLQGVTTPPPPPGNAPLARQKARLQEARRRHDREVERETAELLARELVLRQSELDTAVLLARRALALQETPELRDELVGWLIGQGDHEAAASELRRGIGRETGVEAAQRWARLGDALARAGDSTAADALQTALTHDPSALVVREVLGSISFWAPAQVKPEVGAALLLEASRDRLRAGDREGALEDRLRAVELVGTLEATEALADLLLSQGRAAAADEVLRRGAKGNEAAATHRKRILRALEAKDIPRALGAALDGGFEERGGEDGELFEVLLDLAGLHDLLAARRELRAEASTGEERAELYAELGRMLGSHPTYSKRAAAAWSHVLEKLPGNPEALEALRGLGVPTQPPPPLDEAALRQIATEASGVERADALMRLCAIARRRGDWQGALRESLRILEFLPEHREALAMTAALGALLGASTAKIEATAALTVGLPGEIRSTVLSWAARAIAAQGDLDRARKLAEQASHADPDSPRAAVALAERYLGVRDRVAALALERAVALTIPTGELCRELLRIHEALNQPEVALAWAQRGLALRPGDQEAILDMLRCAVHVESADRLDEVLDWVCALALPIAPIAAAVGPVLDALARTDAARAAAAAGRLLDAHGPQAAALREAAIRTAEIAGDHDLAAAIWERWLVGHVPPQERPLGWQRAAYHHDLAGDVYSAARALSRALKDGAPVSDVLVQTDLLVASEPDGRLALLELRAEVLTAMGQEKHHEAALHWREVGAARWSWAGDRVGMVRAWVRAAELEPIQGPARLVRDLYAFMGPSEAVEELLLQAEQKKSPRESAHVLSLAALAAFQAKERSLAFATAVRAVQLDPSRAEALAIAEVAADISKDLEELEGLYELLASSAKGKFGRRAVHYRAARVLEGWGHIERAARHALMAFEQVPSMGTPFALMRRLAEEAGLTTEMVETLGRVAATAPTAQERWTWWLRAAEGCGGDTEGRRRRAEVLLRAVREHPDRGTVEATAEALAATTPPGDLGGLQRFEEARQAILRKINGPDGARVAVSFALAALRTFRSGRAATAALCQALELDADIDEYAEVLPSAQLLAEAELEEPDAGLVATCRILLRKPFANVGAAALRLCAHTAILERNREAAIDFLLRAAKRFDDDEGLITEARLASVVFPETASTLQDAYQLPEEETISVGGPPDERSLVQIQAREARQEGNLEALLKALRRLVEIEPDKGNQEALLRELASLLSEGGDPEEARAAWGMLLERKPTDREALMALEQLAMDSGDHEELVTILGRRCESTSDPEELRVLRLRRAALLEQRLGRIREAQSELESLLERQGDDPSATRYLADLLERQGNFLEAGTWWLRAFHLQVDPRDRTDLAVRAAQAFANGGELDRARAALDAALLSNRSERLLELRVDLERASGNLRSLADALDELAIASMASPERRAELLLEASRASLAVGDENASLERAQRAARIAPYSAAAQLQARLMEYRARGAGTPQEAAQTIEDLRRVSGIVPTEQIPLHAFLLAEALDAIHGGNAGMRELSARHAELGAMPLIALGMAERLARASNFQAALPFYEAALAGDLLNVRRRGSLALAAADAAQRINELARAQEFLKLALQDPATQGIAQQRLAALEQLVQSKAAQEAADPRRALEELALRAVGLERARILAQLARLTVSLPEERAKADRLFSEAILAAYLDPTLRMELEAEQNALRGKARTSPPPAALPLRETPRHDVPPSAQRPAISSPPSAPNVPEVRPKPPPPREIFLTEQTHESEAPLSPASEHITLIPKTATEIRQQFLLHPSRAELLEALRDAASKDHHLNHARALEHILRTFSPGAEPLPPPPLSAQREEPETILKLLARGSTTTATEALALVWEGASQLFRRDLGSYGLTGLDRVALSGNTLVSRVYATTARVLGTSRTPLFQRRSHGPVTASVALLVPPAVVLSGDPREESPELLFRLGFAFLAALPEHALIFGLQEAQLRSLLAAIRSAFGPPEEPLTSASIASLGGSLWQTIPARGQRRLTELCANPADLSLERASTAAHRISLRAGLFLCGDLGVALRETIAAQEIPLSPPNTFPALAAACEHHPEILDLLAMATSPEFADARWRSEDRGKHSPSGTFRLT
ncbi:MAG: hypothetical protein RMJ98_07690 [Myxococcales bacterium]|nr:hypothetical protein [Polyangiaceae bacterium]MDW8249168.1 hypothetical protein [Myxococcales bacterium]